MSGLVEPRDVTVDTTAGTDPSRAQRRPTRRRSVADREAAAQRFLIDTVDDRFDPDIDIDWSAPPSPDAAWLPEGLVGLAGTRPWRRLTPAARVELGRHGLVDLLTLAAFATTAQSMLEFRRIGEDQTLCDDTARWGFATINIRTTSTAMFGRLVTVTGLPPGRHATLARRFERYTLLTPAGGTTAALYLLGESFVHGVAAALAEDPGVQPHARQVADIYLRATRRLREFAHLDFATTVPGRNRLLLTWYSIAAAVVMRAVTRALDDADAEHAAGVPRWRLRLARRRAPMRARRAHILYGEFLEAAREAGMFTDPVSRLLVRSTGARLDTSAEGDL
ncbi:diiron oxygenase [Williamsia serinedens]|uniref:p-aminobenzoate N-oxygenase AurF n=1 Tax=Williamsia serinedens TaxID=391736 RepID=A0ABT1GYL1_9NOCA|nr:diiron oxygenase [Williamsia serinedens]MCP2160080.1 P-aminobenzoate N-oxygenase AurF [Williamsia serinedens]